MGETLDALPRSESDPVASGLAARVRALRQQHGWTARALAERCAAQGMPRLTRSTIAKIESGVRATVSGDEAQALARALGVTTDYLLSGDDSVEEGSKSLEEPFIREGTGGPLQEANSLNIFDHPSEQASGYFASIYWALANNIGLDLLGKSEQIRLALTCLLAGGHILIEDVPGTGKTTLAMAIARSIAGTFRRIQFTPDLLPDDVTGTVIQNRRNASLEFRAGPVFANVLLADEINKASPRSRAALLEVMQDNQVTVGGYSHALPRPFLVIATQNLAELEETTRLRGAELDHFLMRLSVGHPDQAVEEAILLGMSGPDQVPALRAVTNLEQANWMINYAGRVHVDPSIAAYVAAIGQATRSDPQLRLGVSLRGSLALLRCAKVWAACEGREYVLPEDVKAVAPYVLAHRVSVRPDAERGGVRVEDTIVRLLRSVREPRAPKRI